MKLWNHVFICSTLSCLQVICSLCKCQVDVQHVINIEEVCFHSSCLSWKWFSHYNSHCWSSCCHTSQFDQLRFTSSSLWSLMSSLVHWLLQLVPLKNMYYDRNFCRSPPLFVPNNPVENNFYQADLREIFTANPSWRYFPDDRCFTQLTFMIQYYFLLIFCLICNRFCIILVLSWLIVYDF